MPTPVATHAPLDTSGTCRGCGRRIVWAKTPKGANVPLEDVSGHVYRVAGLGEAGHGLAAVPYPYDADHRVFMSHFISCPARDRFHSSKAAQRRRSR